MRIFSANRWVTIMSRGNCSRQSDVSLTAGQVKRVTFDATLGGTVALQLSGVTTTPLGSNVLVKIYRPDVGAITPDNYYTYFATTSTSTLNLSNLPVGGTYTVTVESDDGLPAKAKLTVFPGVADSALVDGVVLSKHANVVGQNVYLTFDASLGDNRELAFTNVNVPGADNNGFEVNVYSANGTNVADFYCFASNPGSSCMAHLWGLAAGTYSVMASPTWSGTIEFNASITKDVLVSPLSVDKAMDMTLEAGQVNRSTFVAEEGGTAVLQLSGVSTNPTGGNVTVKVYRPDVGAITPGNYYGTFAASTGDVLSLTNLPIGGTYTATVEADYGLPAAARVGFSNTVGTIINAQ